jgi:6-pyruvoyl-tetrahydropterin synthase
MSNQVINKRLQIIKELAEELNVLKEQFDDALLNDPQYQEVQERVDELKTKAKEETAQVKEKILAKDSVKAIQEDIKERKEEIRNHKEILSQELVEYYKETGSNEIEDLEGNVKKMKFSVKLIS